MNEQFHGCKVAFFHGDSLLVYKRDNKEGIVYPGWWDFPGGGREGEETAEECVLREFDEEFGLQFPAERLRYKTRYATNGSPPSAYFFVGEIYESELADISFGEEGQFWKLMSLSEFFSSELVHPAHKRRLQEYIDLEKSESEGGA